jgi:hypothetical protein
MRDVKLKENYFSYVLGSNDHVITHFQLHLRKQTFWHI